jgi:hypothetical protein
LVATATAAVAWPNTGWVGAAAAGGVAAAAAAVGFGAATAVAAGACVAGLLLVLGPHAAVETIKSAAIQRSECIGLLQCTAGRAGTRCGLAEPTSRSTEQHTV